MMMRRTATVIATAALAFLSACVAPSPPARMQAYLPADLSAAASRLPQAPIRTALVLIADTTAHEAAPPPPDEALTRLAEELQARITQDLPHIKIERVLPADGIDPAQAHDAIRELGRRAGYDHVLVMIASSTEKEYPMTLFLGWTSHAQPGWRRDNWSLLEAALVDVRSGETLLRAEGRGWATLDRPAAPGINQWYPVVYLRPNDPVRRIWPPTYAGAPNTLRVVAIHEAAKRLVLGLQDAWINKRQAEQALAAS